MPFRKNFLFLLPVLLLISGCARAPREAGVLRLTQESDASTLDPATSYDSSSIAYVRVLYRGLVDYGDGPDLHPEVAEKYTISPDGKTYTFTLRKDVRFHSGRRVVAEDFRYAMERVLDPATASDGLKQFTMIVGAEAWSKDRSGPKKLQHIRGIEVPNEDTIIYHLNKPDSTFLNWLALPFAYAVPRESVEKWGKSFSEHPNGCGPFKMREWVHDAWLKLDKNEDYFRPELPKAQSIEVRFGNSATLQIMRFEQGQSDVLFISDANAPDFLRLTNDPKWQPQITHAPMMDIRYMTLNTEMKPFTDVRVRQAMNYAIDRKRIVSFLAGRATLASGVLPPQMPGYNPAIKGYAYDPKKAKALIKAAGLEGKFPRLTLWYSTNEPWYEKAAQSIQSDLRKIGLEITTKGVRYSELKARAGQRKNTEMALMGWFQDFPDPSNFYDPLLNGKSISQMASVNRAFYSDAKVNALLERALVEQDHAQRMKMYQDAGAMIVADAPWVFLHHTERYAVQQPWTTGFKLHPMWSQRLEYVGTK